MVKDWVVFKYGDSSFIGEILQTDETKVVIATLGSARFVINKENVIFQGTEAEVRTKHAAVN